MFATRLLKARKMSGLSLDELSQRSDISKPALSKYENSLRMPDSENILRLSKALNVDMDFFFSQPSGNEIRLNSTSEKMLFNIEPVENWSFYYREQTNINKYDINSIKEQASHYLERILELEKISDAFIEFKNPIDDMQIKNTHDAEDAAKKVRKRWKLGNMPLKNIINLLETKGIKIFQIEEFEFDGFAAWAGDLPIIVLNTRKELEITRQRFTALHELGHLILQIQDVIEDELLIEKICDAFASELLIPLELLQDELGKGRTRISMSELRNIKALFGVSIMAIMTKAVLHGIIDATSYNTWKNHYRELYLSGTGDFGSYEGTEKSNRFNQLLFKSLIENRLSVNKAASLSNMTVNQIQNELNFNNEIYNC